MSTILIDLQPTWYAVQAAEHPTGYHGTDPWFLLNHRDTWSNEEVEFQIPSGYHGPYTKFVLHFNGADSVQRIVQGGDVSQGVYAFLSAQAAVISAHPIERKPVIEARIGDLIVVPSRDVVMRIIDGGRWAGPELEILAAPAATLDLTEEVAAYNAYCRSLQSR